MRRYLALLIVLSGCGLYFDGDDDPPPVCNGYGAEGAPLELRDPSTGACTSFGGWTGCDPYTDENCCPQYAADLAPLPDWGYCTSQCTGLDEASCLSAPGCNASYDLAVGAPDDAGTGAGFLGCWATAQSGPIEGGGCAGLDAYACSQHDDCSLYYEESAGATKFLQCGPEPTTNGCEAVDCGPGSHCEQQCYPCDLPTPNGMDCSDACSPTCVPDDPNTCDTVDCGPGSTCVMSCESGMPTDGGAMVPGECYPTCVSTGGGDPGACTGDVSCDALPPACPAGTLAGVTDGCWSGYCIPEADCGPHDPGTCDQATCLAPAPACPQGTVPGVLDGCYTGYCIPASSCPQAACEQLTDEQACSARSDCRAVYSGANCTCDASGCTCDDLTFARCETSWAVPL
jgi:hypothetical protein